MSSRRAKTASAIDSAEPPVVMVVDDDPSMRSALRRLFVSAHLTCEHYASGAEFLAQARMDRPGCVILDVGMPGMNGLEVQARLKQRHVDLPVIFLTGTTQIPIAVAAMREGAIDFVEKPFDNDDLVARVRNVVERHRRERSGGLERREIRRRLQLLTPREREVLELLVHGKTNKEIARTLGASHRTIEVHRRNTMEKMGAPTLADLVRMCLSEASEPPSVANA
jgi:two-component system response regulator FixJ